MQSLNAIIKGLA